MPLNIYQEKPKHPLAGIKTVLAVAAGKGGVGKSVVTVNLALALHSCGYRVGILDSDLYGPSIRKMLPEQEPPKQQGEQLIPARSHGIHVMSMAYFRKEDEAAIVRAPVANRIIGQFIHNVEWGELDYLLIDFPPGTGDIQLTLAQQAHLSGVILVTTPQEIALLDVRKAYSMFEHVHIPTVGVVENMSYYLHPPTEEKLYLFGKGGGDKLASECKVPLLESIPISPLLSLSADRGTSLFEMGSKEGELERRLFLSLAQNVEAQMQMMRSENGAFLQNFELIWKNHR